jgi:hypothetical protein
LYALRALVGSALPFGAARIQLAGGGEATHLAPANAALPNATFPEATFPMSQRCKWPMLGRPVIGSAPAGS